MSYTVNVTRAKWVCDHCRDENEYVGLDAVELAHQGGAKHRCRGRSA
jgi:hypothetical protein